MSGAPNNTHVTSVHQYLVMWHKESRTLPSLFNPVTNKEVHLPTMELSWFDEVHVNGDSLMIYRKSPSEISSWQLGDANWSSRNVNVPDSLPMLAYCKGFCFDVDKSDWTTNVLDADTGTCVLKIPPPISKSGFTGFDYLIESFGDLLGVCRLTSVWVEESHFVVYRLHSDNDNFNWVKTSNIGDCILLLDKHTGTGLSVRGKDHGLKGSCAYFHGFRHVNGWQFTVFHRYEMEDDRIEELASLLEPEGCTWSWFVPSLQ